MEGGKQGNSNQRSAAIQTRKHTTHTTHTYIQTACHAVERAVNRATANGALLPSKHANAHTQTHCMHAVGGSKQGNSKQCSAASHKKGGAGHSGGTQQKKAPPPEPPQDHFYFYPKMDPNVSGPLHPKSCWLRHYSQQRCFAPCVTGLPQSVYDETK